MANSWKHPSGLRGSTSFFPRRGAVDRARAKRPTGLARVLLLAAGLAALTAIAGRGAEWHDNVLSVAKAHAAAPSTGLVAYWSFDEGSGTTAPDGSGNGHTGTLTYGPTWASTSSCKSGGCLSFDGVNDYVRIASAPQLQITGDVTVSAWIKPASLGKLQSIVSKRYEFELGPIHDRAPYPLKWSYKASSGTLVSGDLTSSTELNQWQHVVLVRNAATGQMTGYKNGSRSLRTAYTLAAGTSSYYLNIGRNPGGSQHFKGLIDEVRIYNRVLTDAEVAALYSPAPDTTPPSTPTGVIATAVSANRIDLSWTAATDDVAVASYRIYRDGTQTATSTTTSYQDAGLSPSTTYSYMVDAIDTSGNVSPQSAPVVATTPEPDSTPPVISAVAASAVTSSSALISWTTDEPADSQVEYGTAPQAYTDSTQLDPALVTSHAQTLSGLASSTTYYYRVKSRDASGNLTVSDESVFTTSAAPPQREDVTLASGFTNPTAMAVAPDGRVFVAEQGGALRIVKNNTLLATPFLSVSVASDNERGLLGIAFDPGFAANGYVYIYYTADTTPIVNRVSRFTVSSGDPDRADLGSEVIILDNIPSQNGWHNGGAVHFGPDGKLYVAVGEGHMADTAQSLSTLAGKLLRIDPSMYDPGDPNAVIPTDNPFYGSATGVNRVIWALGLRNPFTFDIQPGTGRIFINDVGDDSWEEINEAWAGPNTGSNAGFNFGWPTTEGPTAEPSFHTPFYAYPHAGGDCAITGGSFYNPSNVNFPVEHVADYFFADFCSGWIKSLDLSTGAVSDFIGPDGARDPVDVEVGDDGSLYYLARAVNGISSVHRVRYVNTNQPPSIVSHPQSVTVPVGGVASFSVSAGGTAPLSYQWQRDGVDIAGATGATYTLTNVQTTDSGAQFRVVVTNSLGTATSNPATLTVTTNQPPTAFISEPPAGSLYSAGDTIAYTGTGTDAEEGSLPASAFAWKVDFHHEDHVHPHIPETTGSTSGSFAVPTTGETSADVFFRIYLTVRDSGGLPNTTYRDVTPRKANITLATNVPGLQLTLDGQPIAALPYTVTGVVGATRTLAAPSPQTVGGRTYEFVSWSDGGAQSHAIATPGADATYTATYQEVGGSAIPTQGLVAYWSFDEGSGTTAGDGSGNGHTGTLTYGPTWASASSCNLGGCLSFDGVNDYVRIPVAAQLVITGDITIAAWIKPTSLGTKQSIVSKRYEFELGHIHDAAPYPLKWSHKEPSGTFVSGDLTTSTEANQWQHVVLVRNAATRQITGYKNGSQSVTSTYTLAPGTSSYNVNIGRNAGGSQHFKGLIDEVRVYNRVLADAEIGALFNQQ